MNFIKQNKTAWYYFFIVITLTTIIFIIKPSAIIPVANFLINIFKKIIPIFILVFILMFLTNLFIQPAKLIKWLGHESGIKGWIIAILGGIISSGPIYMWYPLLAELKNKGMKISLITTFLYNRAIKIPLLPLMIFYFNLKYVLILTVVMIFMSIINGKIVELFLKNERGYVNPDKQTKFA